MLPHIPSDQCSPYGTAAERRNEPARAAATQQHPRRHGDRGDPDDADDAASALDVWLSFADLKRVGLVDSWKTLRHWQRDKRIGFPKGRLLAPNTRRWSKRDDIDPWLASRPVERAAFGDAERDDDDAERAAAEA